MLIVYFHLASISLTLQRIQVQPRQSPQDCKHNLRLIFDAMKFGKTYLSHQIPEWSIYYMNYKHLKKIIKSIDPVKEEENEIDEASYPELVLETLSSFFLKLIEILKMLMSFTMQNTRNMNED